MRKFNEEEQKEIISLYQKDNMTIDFIRKKFHCRDEAIRSVLLSNGVEIVRRRTVNSKMDENYFSKIDSEEKAYILGLLFTDGNVSPDKNRQPNIRIGLKLSDVNILLRIKEELKLGSSLIYDKRANKESVVLAFRSQRIADDLKKFGIVPNKTYLTSNLPNIENSLLPHFIRGLIDGDGSIFWEKQGKKWVVDFSSYHQSICEELQKIINTWINKENYTKIANYGTAFHVRWRSTKESKKIMEILYRNNNISIARKNRLANAILEDKSGEDIV